MLAGMELLLLDRQQRAQRDCLEQFRRSGLTRQPESRGRRHFLRRR